MPQSDRFNKISIEVDYDRCLHARTAWSDCSLCMDGCPSGALRPGDRRGVPSLDAARCMNCGQCLSACPLEAFTSPQFSERQIIGRVGRDERVRVRCFLPYGELDGLDLGEPFETYHLGTCMAALSAGALFELALTRRCELATDQCAACKLFPRIEATMRRNVTGAYDLLRDWGAQENLTESSPLFLPREREARSVLSELSELSEPGGPNGSNGLDGLNGPSRPSGLGQQSTGLFDEDAEREAAWQATLDDIHSSVRMLFHGKRERESGGILPRPELRVRRYKRKHVPEWRQRLQAVWNRLGGHEGVGYRWPKQAVDVSACRACGTCMQMCPTGSIRQTMGEGVFVYEFVPGTCADCGLCVSVCPVKAIEREHEPLDQPFYSVVCYSEEVRACSKCGIPIPARDGGDICWRCASRPDPDGVMRTIRRQLGIESPAEARQRIVEAAQGEAQGEARNESQGETQG